MNHWVWCTYKNGHKEGIGSHTKGDKEIHEPNKIRHLDTDDVGLASTVTAVLEIRAFVAFDFFIVFVFVNCFIILLQGWDKLKSTKIQESSGATNWSTTFNSWSLVNSTLTTYGMSHTVPKVKYWKRLLRTNWPSKSRFQPLASAMDYKELLQHIR